MFGYIGINKPELKIKEFERYHAYYCGVCRDLKKNYGLTGQMTLSYDLTFLAVLLSGLYEPEETVAKTRCVLHPAVPHDMIRNEYTAYAASMNVLLAFHKALDDRRDEHKLRGAAVSSVLLDAYKKAATRYPKQERAVKHYLSQSHKVEAENNMDEDLCAGHFGRIMGALFVMKDDVWKPYLWRLGFYLGKFVYLMDAFCDVEQDIKTNAYNPLRDEYEDPEIDFDEHCEQLLRMMIAESARAFEALPVLRDAGLIRNILYSGVWNKWKKHERSV